MFSSFVKSVAFAIVPLAALAQTGKSVHLMPYITLVFGALQQKSFPTSCHHLVMRGPRPHVPRMLAAGMPYEELVDFCDRRRLMRPSITGLAQAHGLRGPTTEPEPAALRVVRDF